MTKVVKFGGSSVASASQLRKIFEIICADKERKFIVVSAPGKRDAEDIKVTDLLIAYYRAYKAGKSVAAAQDTVIQRYAEIAEDLGLPEELMSEIADNFQELATLDKKSHFLYDSFLAAGEDNCAKLVAAYFKSADLPARYVSPKDAGILVSSEPSNARLLIESYKSINYLNELPERLVIPGFFGMTKNDEICTFSRGGSDITGSIIAAGVKADLYENFTDVDGIFSCNPEMIENPDPIHEVTFREMRELAYFGFSVLHDEALAPVFRAGIPIVIKNTNNPAHPGTRIIESHTENFSPVVGIASNRNFTVIHLRKYLLNHELGFGRRMLQVLEELNIHVENLIIGVDEISIIIRGRYLSKEKEQAIGNALVKALQPEVLNFEHNFSIIVLVGESMKGAVGLTARAAKSLSDSGVNINMLNQGSSECSIMFVVKTHDEKTAVQVLYQAFFEK
jgi:aspartate kinase